MCEDWIIVSDQRCIKEGQIFDVLGTVKGFLEFLYLLNKLQMMKPKL